MVEKAKLTEKQRQILTYIGDRIAELGHSPTIREIGEVMGISSTNGVRQHISALIKKGYLKKSANIARGLQPVQAVATAVARLPLVGTVTAGLPIDAIENIEGEIALDADFAPKDESFTLRVSGDSMKDIGILDGDIVVVKKQQVARKGDVVVAIIGNEATVKRYVPDGNRIRLEAENEAYEPIIVDRDSPDFRIAGKVVGLIRKF